MKITCIPQILEDTIKTDNIKYPLADILSQTKESHVWDIDRAIHELRFPITSQCVIIDIKIIDWLIDVYKLI